MVEMLLEHIQKHPYARAVVYVFQLVGRKLINHNGIGLDVLHDVKTRDADVARQNGIATR